METLNQLVALLTSHIGSGHTTGTVVFGLLAVLLVAPVLVLSGKKIKALKPPLTLPALCGCAPATDPSLPAPGFFKRCLMALDYLRTDREWRYGMPWIMVLGERGAGKTSLLTSIAPTNQQALHGRQAQLAIKGTHWHDLNKGFFIDPDGQLPYDAAIVADTGSAERTAAFKKWSSVLTQLEDLRPERALDGVLLVISARSLQQQGAEQRLETAENIRRQLNYINQQVEFALPVYVVISELDTVAGFTAFWRAQPSYRYEEIVGWSAPDQSNDASPAEWVDAAFQWVDQQIKPLYVEAAAEGDRIHTLDADQFFLFANHFKRLREPVQQCLAVIFQASPWQASFFCRGIYFTGVVAASGDGPVEQAAPRQDVSFVTDLMLNKILAEPGLGRPTRAGIWSRNLLIRRLQGALVAGFAILLLGFLIACFAIHSQVEGVIGALKQIQQQQTSIPNDGSCVLQQPVYELLEQISTIDARARSWTIPLSLFDKRLERKSAQRIASDAFKNVILPGIACQIKQRSLALYRRDELPTSETGYPQALDDLLVYIQQLTELEKNAARFTHVLGMPPFSERAVTLPEFIALTEYAYGVPVSARVKSGTGLLPASLDSLGSAGYKFGALLPPNFKHNTSTYIAAYASQLNVQLMAELERGAQLLVALEQRQQPLLQTINHFSTWLNWVRQSWLGSSVTSNPITTIQTELAARLQPLIKDYAYPAAILNTASAAFDVRTEYPIAMGTLNKMVLPEYGSLFTVQDNQLGLNPKLAAELVGLQAVSELEYMKVDPLAEFVCQGNVSNWNSDYLNQALGYANQYQALLGNPALKEAGQQAMYLQLAVYQLGLAMNTSLQQAQVSGANGVMDAGQGITVAQPQSKESSRFAALLAQIQSIDGVFKTRGLVNNAAYLTECVSQFASENLEQIQRLAEQSMLYQPPQGSDNNFFDLGSTPVVNDYLARQMSRVQVLVDYATPFLNFMKQVDATTSPNTAQASSPSYWNNTAAELQRYTQAKDPNGQAALLENLFLKVLPGLNENNCSDILGAYKSAPYGNDLFSEHRKLLETQVQRLCTNKRSAQAATLYQQWATRFNLELAGRYPFGNAQATDASLATVKAFFKDYEANSASLSQSLVGQSGSNWDNRRSFLDQLNKVAAFLHNSLVQADSSSAAITLGVKFRPLAGEGSDQVVSWQLAAAGNSVVFPNQGNSLVWPFGQALALNLAWAGNSLWRPALPVTAGDLSVEGTTASFVAEGNWALLRFIQNHPAHSGALDTAGNTTQLLEFDVPLISGNKPAEQVTTGGAVLYLSLQLSSIDPKTMAPANVTLPDTFPYVAPQ